LHGGDDSTRDVCHKPFGLKRINIMPGEHSVSWSAVELITVLGSCISACIWDSRLKIGGMNHFMLPDHPVVSKGEVEKDKPLRYGTYAMERLINDLAVMGSKREHMVAKVFGGANMTNALNAHNIGQRNAEFVMAFLEKEGIRVECADLLGAHSRRLIFYSDTGVAYVRKMVAVDEVVRQQERRYLAQINQNSPFDSSV
jgi:chemotaxis protein CheD